MIGPRRAITRSGALAVLALATLSLAGCSDGALGISNQVIVHLDQDPNDLAAAQRVADAACRTHGGTARFVTRVVNDNGPRENDDPSPPDAVFACDPAPAGTAPRRPG